MSRKTIIKTPEQISNIREAGKYLTELLHICRDAAQPWVTGLALEHIAQNYLDTHDLIGAFKGYWWFPANLCISVNDCVVHGIPDETVFHVWDLLKIDVGVTYQWGIADAAISLVVGGAHEHKKWQHLIDTTKWWLNHGLAMVRPGASLFWYGKAVYEYINNRNCSIIKTLTWHGVGVDVHEWPTIYNRPNGHMQHEYFQPGMVIALEPITAMKSTDFVEKPGVPWNLYTRKGDLGAQWEYTIVITETGYEVLAWIV